MMKCLAIAAGALLTVSLFSGHVQAQTFGGGFAKGGNHSLGSPTTSPYLNLLTVDNFGIAGGYQTLVKPFVDGRKAINANSAAISRMQSGGGGGAFGGGRPQAGYFMNYMHYYPTLSGGGGGGGR